MKKQQQRQREHSATGLGTQHFRKRRDSFMEAFLKQQVTVYMHQSRDTMKKTGRTLTSGCEVDSSIYKLLPLVRGVKYQHCQ